MRILVVLVVLLVAADAVLTVEASDSRASFDGLLPGIALVFAAVGLIVARRKPANPIGWLFLGAAVLFALTADSAAYRVLDFREHGGSLPVGRLAWALSSSWVLGMTLVGLALVLFPDGVVPSRRWRRALTVYLGVGVWWTVWFSASEVTLTPQQMLRVDRVGDTSGPTSHLSTLLGGIGWVVAPVFVGFWIAFVVRQAAAWRRAHAEQREQLKWLMSGGAISLAGIVFVVNVPGDRVVTDLGAIGIAALPIGIGIGILKYRLYEIDRLISRTLSYLIVTGLLVGVFVGIVVLATDILPFSSPVAVAASTLAAAALFNPLRKQVQRLVDRRFNRARYDADAIVAAFTAHLRHAVDLDTVRSELLTAVDGAVEPTHATLWMRPLPEASATG